ncbi:MAG: MlaC/ttg2D family ABC transporter substrate-binding protein [Desulfovibrionales bacterium]
MIPHKSLFTASFLLAVVLAVPHQVRAGQPMEFMQQKVKAVLTVLAEPKTDSGGTRRIERLRSLSQEIFDFIELSRRTLGRHWNRLTKEQRKEFTFLFSRLLEKTYLDRIQEYSKERVEFNDEILFTEKRAEVKTSIVQSSKRIPISYRLLKKEKGWRVYDVQVEGVSLVKNYRTQFASILSRNAPEKLLQMMRDKVQVGIQADGE